MNKTADIALPQTATGTPSFTVTTGHLTDGVWHARVDRKGAHAGPPDLVVTCQGRDLTGVELTPDGEGWLLRITLPTALLSDGVHSVVISERLGGARLQAIHIAAGAVLDEDLRAEIALLRAELDLVKRALRRHCAASD